MATCDKCGRKTQIISQKLIKSGKNAGWKKVGHRCELHGVSSVLVRPAINDGKKPERLDRR